MSNSSSDNTGSIGQAFNQISNSNFLAGNTEIFSALLQYNLLWSAVFILGINLLLSTMLYYIPLLSRVPMLQTVNNLIWFVACLLLSVLIYGSSENTVVRVFGGIFLFLLLISLGITCYRLIAFVTLFYHHRSWSVAVRAPICLNINGKYFSLDHAPACVVITQAQGTCYFHGSSLGPCDPATVSIVLYSGSISQQYSLHRNAPKKQSVTVTGEPQNITVYTPADGKTDV